MSIRQGSTVRWKWGSGTAEAVVAEVHHGDVTITSKGQTITRHGGDDNPAYVLLQEDGTKILKLRSEVEHVSKG